VKITSNNEEMLRAAVEQFIDKTDKEIEEVAMLTLEGHQRAIMGAMTVDEIFKDRKKFSSKVFDIASTDLFNMGIQVISYTLKVRSCIFHATLSIITWDIKGINGTSSGLFPNTFFLVHF